jgi:GNAT superfamily N-acetyltransferase
MSEFRLVVEDNPAQADLDAVIDALNQHNIRVTGLSEWSAVAVFVRDEHGRMLGGVTGEHWADAFEIGFLWLSEKLRGQGIGTRLMQMIEQRAIALGCTQIALDTFDFQARDFYLKLGYEVYGELDHFPKDHHKYFMRKRLKE